jgi:hypothetical protein
MRWYEARDAIYVLVFERFAPLFCFLSCPVLGFDDSFIFACGVSASRHPGAGAC